MREPSSSMAASAIPEGGQTAVAYPGGMASGGESKQSQKLGRRKIQRSEQRDLAEVNQSSGDGRCSQVRAVGQLVHYEATPLPKEGQGTDGNLPAATKLPSRSDKTLTRETKFPESDSGNAFSNRHGIAPLRPPFQPTAGT